MYRKSFKFLALFIALGIGMLSVGMAHAGTPYNASFTTSITYMNVGDSTANIVFTFYPENGSTGIDVSASLPQDAGGSLFVGNVSSISSGFNGSVVMSSDQPVVATTVQISNDSAVKNRPLSNGFTSGSSNVLLATLLKNKFKATSRFSVQNAHNTSVDLKISVYDADNPTAPPIVINHNGLPVGAAKYFDLGTLAQISASTFNGSAVVEAFQAGTTTPANIVATVLELGTSDARVSAFEGVNGGASTVYMPSALCQFGSTQQNSFYAVQNTSTTATATVTVSYSTGGSASADIGPGAKFSFAGCNGMSNGSIGSATITAVVQSSTTPTNIVVIGKVTGGGITSAFVGATDGGNKLALPYIRWTTNNWTNGNRQRSFIAIQNVGSSNLNANDVTVKYVNKDGVVVGTHNLGAIAAGAKANSNASLAAGSAANLDEFGYIGGFGGAVIIEGPPGSELVAVVRVLSNTGGSSRVGEDYNGIKVD